MILWVDFYADFKSESSDLLEDPFKLQSMRKQVGSKCWLVKGDGTEGSIIKEIWTKQRNLHRLFGFCKNNPMKLGSFTWKTKPNCMHFSMANLAELSTQNEADQWHQLLDLGPILI